MSHAARQSLADRLFDLALAPAIDMLIVDDGAARTITHNDARLLLQRRRSTGDCRRWRTVIEVRQTHLRLTEAWVSAAQVLDASVEWRLTLPDGRPINAAPGAAETTTTTTEKANDPAT